MHQILKTYQKRLPNLSEKNRSLFLPKATERQFVDVQRFDFLDDKPAFSIIERLIARRKKIVLSKDLDPRDKDANQVGRILKNILRTDKFIREERGAKDLLLGYPFVEGKTQDDKCMRCPLIFFPVSIKQENGKWFIGLRDTEEIKFNHTFLLAYAQFNQTKLEQNLLDISLDNLSKDAQVFRNELYEILENSQLNLNFNQANFENRLSPFSAITKTDFSLLNQTGKLKLMPHAVLGVFARSDSFLAPDYEFLIKNTANLEIENLFENTGYQNFTKNNFSEQQNILPYPIDSSQEQVLNAVKTGNSIVVQGPPGTGKSQLISNLIADNIANHKRVLLVCQKRVALDVVYQRLAQKNIQNYIALIHDFRNDRKKVYQQIGEQIEKVYQQVKQKFTFEIYQLEERFLLLSREIDQGVFELNQFHEALFDYAECGIPVKELYLIANPNLPYTDFSDIYQFLDFSKIYEVKQRLHNYFAYQEQIGQQNYVWKNRKSFAQRTFKDLENLKKLLSDFLDFKTKFEQRSEQKIFKKIDYRQAEVILSQKHKFALWLGFIEAESALQYFRKVLNYEYVDYDFLIQLEKNILECFDNQGVEVSLSIEKLDELEEYLNRYEVAQRSFLTKKKWDFFSENKLRLKQLFEDNHLEFKVFNISNLRQKIQNRRQLELHRQILLQTDWLSPLTSEDETIKATDNLFNIEQTFEKDQFKTWFTHYRSALKAKILWEDGISEILNHVIHQNSTYRRLSKLLFEASFILKKFIEQKNKYLFYLRNSQFEMLWNSPEQAIIWASILERDFELLCASDKLRDSFTEVELRTVNILKKYKSKYTPDEIIALFDNSIRMEWIGHIERKYPILRAVSSLKIKQLEKNLQQVFQEKQKISEAILNNRVIEKSAKNLKTNRLGNIIDYRNLLHQVNKKRNIWTLRKLMQEFSDEIFRLIPCWMASPESVSAIFEPQKIFDLVIFDEASQCYAEKGIPAMYRGQQVVIAGDSEQLQPTNLYTPKWEEDIEENAPELEIDSLLDLGNRYLNSAQLNGHYRSQSLDLIDFSNQYFYKNQLKLIPDYQNFIKNIPAIHYYKVEGVWAKNTNSIEAQYVVDLVKKLLMNGEKNIGIITFNYPQQSLILDLFEAQKIALPETLFVKNIENVQGDERDIIIFSIGYAPTENGRFRMNFGLLSQEKGENRLNVAVTRAKQKIYVISSIFPHQIKADELKHKGAKLLQKYLQYALDVSENRYTLSFPKPKKYYFSTFLKESISTYFETQLEEQEQTFKIHTHLPFVDLVIEIKDKNNKTAYKSILTDDDLFHDTLSAKENHIYLPQLLHDKNWTFLRVYSREYWQNQEKLFQKIIHFIQS